MFKRILLPLDLSDKHDHAVRTAADLVKASAGSVTLVHVVEPIPGLAHEEDPVFYDRLGRSAQKHLEKIGKKLSTRKIKWQAVILFGHRVEETVRYARDEKCDLIIATAPTFDPSKPTTGWGSLSFKISVLSPAPVLLVKA
jgi:nucleotide-binding universal stress UspA family protein